MNGSPDVIIVGGGIIGCLSAYYLGQHGLPSLIIERDAIGSHASGNSAGMLTPYAAANDPALIALSWESQRLHQELAQTLPGTTDIDYHYGLVPTLRVAFTSEDEEELRRWHQARLEEGTSVTWLSGEETVRLSQGWLSGQVRAAVRSEVEPQVDSYHFLLAVSQAAQTLGSRIQFGEVVGILGNKGRASGIVLADGTKLSGEAVILAMGPWSKLTAPWIGFKIPVEPMRGQIVTVSIPGPLPQLAFINIRGGYIYPKLSGELLTGTTWEWAGFDARVTPEGQESIIQGTLRLSPRVGQAKVVATRACLRPASLDDLPIIGLVPEWENLYLATGHGPEGILLGTPTGKYLAQLIATGRSDYDLSPFSPDRLPARPTGPHL